MFPNEIIQMSHLNFCDDRGELQVVFEGDIVATSIALKRSFSRQGVFRGMHFQKLNAPQVKYIEVLSGSIIDFVVCMDDQKENFGKIYSQKIEPGHTYKIPASYAHGFYAIKDTVFQYITVGAYSASDEISFKLPVEIFAENQIDPNQLIVSQKDKGGADFNDIF